MREIVIVIRDLYLQPQSDPSPGVSAPGIEHLARFGLMRPLAAGWRPWVARWLGLPQYSDQAAASIAAAGLERRIAGAAVWLASPVHLLAGLTSVHFDRRSILRLPGGELEALADSFRATFQGSGFDLLPLVGGDLLLTGPATAVPASTTEPARMPLTSVEQALPAGEGSQALRRLAVEMEMWLHGHPLNDSRRRRGELPVGTLWVWGGGAGVIAPSLALAPLPLAAAAFGADAYVSGLWRLAAAEAQPMPVDWSAVIGSSAARALGVVEVAELLHAHPSWHLPQAVAEIDRRWIAPSLAALHRGALHSLVLLVNDRALSVRPLDRWRKWRRKRTALEGLA